MTIAPPRAPHNTLAPVATPPPPKKRKSPLWAKFLVVIGALLMLSSGAGVIGSKWLIGSATKAVTQQNLLGDTQKTTAQGGGDNLKGPIDILLMGVDARKRWAVDDLRSDTLIVLHIPASHDQAYLVSVPRDTEMRVPAFPKSK